MKEKPIIFTGESIKAIFDGRKTMTRRICKVDWKETGFHSYETKFASVYNNCIWHTWDKDGVGGENSIGSSIEEAKHEAIKSAIKQGFLKSPYQVGDKLWVRESYHLHSVDDGCCSVIYATPNDKHHYIDLNEQEEKDALRIMSADNSRLFVGYHPSIHMPKWATRLWLEVTKVRVERDETDGKWYFVYDFKRAK